MNFKECKKNKRTIKKDQQISPCKRRGAESVTYWACLSVREDKGIDVFEIQLNNEVEEISYKQLKKDAAEEAILRFNKVLGFYLTCHIDKAYVNGQLISQQKEYKIKDKDEIKLELGNKIYNISIKIVNYDENLQLIKDLIYNLKCPICYGIFNYPISISPCFHTYCINCISKWWVKGGANCPTCRQKIIKAQPNKGMERLSLKHLKFNEHLCLSEEEKDHRYEDFKLIKSFIKRFYDFNFNFANFDAHYNINFKRNRPVIKSIELNATNDAREFKEIELNLIGLGSDKKYRMKVDLDSYNKFMKYKEKFIPIKHDYKCRYCIPLDPDPAVFECDSETQHKFCSLCEWLFPEVLSPNGSCDLCKSSYCPTCTKTINTLGYDLTLIGWDEFIPKTFPNVWFDGNIIDSEIFHRYIKSQNLTPKKFYQFLVGKVKADEIILEDFRFQNLSIDSKVCIHCGKRLFDELAFHFRVQLTNEDLSLCQEDPYMIREDCYYGRHCKNKLVTTGIETFNHACHPDNLNHRKYSKLPFTL